jgi:phosphoglycolate phosphatase-like HAD superfamily hydrolase
MNLERIKIFIFDVNGVLLDSNLANARAMAEAFTDDPVVQGRIARVYLTLTGIDRGTKIRTIQEQVIKRPFTENEFELRWKRFKALGTKAMHRAPLLPGCKEVLVDLGRRGLSRVALSNTPVVELRDILASHTLEPLLDVIRGGGDWPKAESLARLLQEYRFQPDHCLFFGDGKGDLAAARLAGVGFVAIDPGTGEFTGEEGFEGPYRYLAQWGERILGMSLPVR